MGMKVSDLAENVIHYQFLQPSDTVDDKLQKEQVQQ